MVRRSAERILYYDVRFREPFLDRAAFQRQRFAAHQVAALVHRRSVRRDSRLRVRNERQRLVPNANKAKRVAGDVNVIRGDGGHLIAHEADFRIQNRHIRRDAAVRNVERSQRRMDARQRQRLRSVNRQNPRVGMRTAKEQRQSASPAVGRRRHTSLRPSAYRANPGADGRRLWRLGSR